MVTVNEIVSVALIYISKGPNVLVLILNSHPFESLVNVHPVKLVLLLTLAKIMQSSLLKALVYILAGIVILIVLLLYILS